KNNRLETVEALVDEKTDIDIFISEKLPDLSLTAYILSETFPERRVCFISGYFSALKTPLLLCGKRALSFAANLSQYVIPLETSASFSSFLKNGVQTWEEAAIKRRAKGLLLERGIPFNEEALANMVIGGNVENMSLFLEAGFSSDTRDRYGVPLLCLASRSGNYEAIKILLKAGANIDLQAGDRLNTALIDSTSGKCREIMKELIDAGADVNLKSRSGQSALIIAVGLNDEESVEMLLKAGAGADDPDSLGASARTYAGLFQNPSIVNLFKTYAPLENGGRAGNVKAAGKRNE
ncbi:MAG: ankyrin repeat domain-containing protein, partial [Treponema sp.]|nr:ankyrin repeat domain-containing protein [Treponema sp.]